MTKIIFIRHGETVWNKQRRFQGQQDSPLSSAGIQQAEKVSEFLQTRTIDAVYSSDLTRALLTAKSIAKHHKLEPIVDQRLREMSFGVWEGKTREQVKLLYPDIWNARRLDYLNTQIPEGELPREVTARFGDFLETLIMDGFQKTFVVVSHGGALRLMIASLLHIPLEKSFCLHQSNTGISELIHSNQDGVCVWEAVCINSTGHLA